MDDMFNQSTPADGAARSQAHDHRPPPREATAQTTHASTPLTDNRPPPSDGHMPTPALPPLQPSAGIVASVPPRASPLSEMDMVDEPMPPVKPAAAYTMHGVDIRPDAPPDAVDRLASRLGRPKANAAAEELIQKWADFIGRLRDNRVPFDKVLEVMFAGPDQDSFRQEFADAGKVTEKSLRKFRTLVGAARKGATSVRLGGPDGA